MMIDAKNVLLISGVLLILGIVGLYIPYVQTIHIREESFPVATSTERMVKITYTNSGFEPSTLTVPVGTTVEWTNTSDKLMWVASNPHPSHTDLPGFDERGVEGTHAGTLVPITYAHTQASVYRYIFLKIGHWGYHNHLVPNDRGAITVAP